MSARRSPLVTTVTTLALLSMGMASGVAQSSKAEGKSKSEASPAADHGDGRRYLLGRSTERIVKSKLGKEYRVMISWPEGEAPAEGHAITYVLDGDDLFPLVTSMLRVQAGTEKASTHNAIKPGLIVGIGYGGKSERGVDYTPKAPPGPPETYRDGRPYPAQKSGGAAEFYDFLEHELKPMIEKEYAIDRQKQSLLGAGYGGLFALHVLFTKPESFQTYVACSPSVWWNDRYILEEERAFTEKVELKGLPHLVMTVGDLEQSLTQHEYSLPEGPREEHALKTARRRMVDNTREMYWRLLNVEGKGLKVTYRVFAGESHKSVVPVSISHALQFIFPPLGK